MAIIQRPGTASHFSHLADSRAWHYQTATLSLVETRQRGKSYALMFPVFVISSPIHLLHEETKEEHKVVARSLSVFHYSQNLKVPFIGISPIPDDTPTHHTLISVLLLIITAERGRRRFKTKGKNRERKRKGKKEDPLTSFSSPFDQTLPPFLFSQQNKTKESTQFKG
jgi:hypothetical protein